VYLNALALCETESVAILIASEDDDLLAGRGVPDAGGLVF
jgi:hypothetical protein